VPQLPSSHPGPSSQRPMPHASIAPDHHPLEAPARQPLRQRLQGTYQLPARPWIAAAAAAAAAAASGHLPSFRPGPGLLLLRQRQRQRQRLQGTYQASGPALACCCCCCGSGSGSGFRAPTNAPGLALASSRSCCCCGGKLLLRQHCGALHDPALALTTFRSIAAPPPA
jgi:hypothetical protein